MPPTFTKFTFFCEKESIALCSFKTAFLLLLQNKNFLSYMFASVFTTFQRCNFATLHAATRLRCHVATLPRCHVATLPRCHVATLHRCTGAPVPPCHRATVATLQHGVLPTPHCFHDMKILVTITHTAFTCISIICVEYTNSVYIATLPQLRCATDPLLYTVQRGFLLK